MKSHSINPATELLSQMKIKTWLLFNIMVQVLHHEAVMCGLKGRCRGVGGAREGGGMWSGRGQGGWGDAEWEGPGRVGG